MPDKFTLLPHTTPPNPTTHLSQDHLSHTYKKQNTAQGTEKHENIRGIFPIGPRAVISIYDYPLACTKHPPHTP